MDTFATMALHLSDFLSPFSGLVRTANPFPSEPVPQVVGISTSGSAVSPVFLPNMLFMIFAWRHQAHTPAKGRVAWSFALGEVCKVLLTFALLVMALAVLKVVFMPLIATWVLVLVVQVLAPAVINNKG